jgi:transposase, IS5 family
MQNTLFSLYSKDFPKYHYFQNSSELGQIHQVIPWKELARLIPSKKHMVGAPSWLDYEGMFALMFLKHYTKSSDEKLVERLNSDACFQLFCGIKNDLFLQPIKDKTLVTRVRKFLSIHLDVNKLQKNMIDFWKPEMKDKNIMMVDATCFEVDLRFPTDVKLLWESVCWLWDGQIPSLCKAFKLPMPRSKFADQKLKQSSYQKNRKNSFKKTQKRRKALLHLLDKGIKAYQLLLNQTSAVNLSQKVADRFKTIKTVYQQQAYLLGNKTTKVADRIVSLSQPHIRPIVRGKENKPVEFGIKVHMAQVDGINIIEHHSFEAFNETTRLKISILKHENQFGKLSHLAADGIYPTNKNRVHCSKKAIQTNFVRKGPGKDDKATKQIKVLLNKERSTRLEGSFGTEKEHYLLKKIKAKTPATQIIWMMFGILTANAVNIAKRRTKAVQKVA